jgi:DNA mismatch repair protein MutS
MEIDKTTYDDLAIFDHEEEFSIFQKFDFTRTLGGRHWLRHYFNNPFSDLKHIRDTQNILSLFLRHTNDWPPAISNGTIMVMERFYETALDTLPDSSDLFNASLYKIFHGPDYSLTRYSLGHFGDFIRGMYGLIELFDRDECPLLLRNYLHRARTLLKHDTIQSIRQRDPAVKLTVGQVIHFGNFIRNRFKSAVLELIDIYGRMDAWYAMSTATQEMNLCIPVFFDQPEPMLDSKGLYHILLPHPVAYDVMMERQANFLFLTGANMAGKSTFIKAVGTAVYLAHLGMGVPAVEMKLSLFDGILSNINVVDNIAKGESYFFNEVKRIKDTILKINDNRKWLVLIDELFKGTNVLDAMKCSSTVIRGLIKIQSSLFILSTHLYEIGEELKDYPNISFKYFETAVEGDQLFFSYQIKDGISNDRLGYLILVREKVVEMLGKL